MKSMPQPEEEHNIVFLFGLGKSYLERKKILVVKDN
jgi:hypothetical protein